MSAQQYNIIYLVCHDIGKHLNTYGATGVPTPNLDAFAANGIQFNSYFTNSPCCSPSRGCAMTGMYAHTNGLMGLVNRGWSLPLETPTIVDAFNDAGYETVHFGHQHERYKCSANRYQVEGAPDYPDDDWVNHDEDFIDVAVDGAIDYLEKRIASDNKKPFYLNIGSLEVHASRWSGNFPSGNVQNRNEVYGEDSPDDAYIMPPLPDTPAQRARLAKFQGAIRFLDTHFQRLLDAVEHLGLRENTIIVFTTDHGIAEMRAKSWLYDRGVEISLLMQLPEALLEQDDVKQPGSTVDHILQNIDIAPTLLDAAGVAIPDAMQGCSFWPLLVGKEYTPHDKIVIERNDHGSWEPMRAVRTPRYHYIRNFAEPPRRSWLTNGVLIQKVFEDWWKQYDPAPNTPRPEEELFDVANDPHEFINLADKPDYAEIKAELSDYLDTWMEETDDPLRHGLLSGVLNPFPTEA